ncbi:MAG: DUF2147 domain-containing protein [Bacteroidales bacterium]|nr:DUF2147 domain-containing protein [Bacteroidales bacterium]
MKKILILLLTVCMGVPALNAQSKADAVCGYYYAQDPFSKEGSQVRIYKNSQGKYDGIIVWVENPEKKHFINYKFLRDFVYDAEEGEWVDGKIYHPGNGKTYKSYLKLENGKLKVRGYVGFSLLGMSMYWNRESKQRVQR